MKQTKRKHHFSTDDGAPHGSRRWVAMVLWAAFLVMLIMVVSEIISPGIKSRPPNGRQEPKEMKARSGTEDLASKDAAEKTEPESASKARMTPAPPPSGSTTVAKVGAETVTFEDIMHAWNRHSQGREPDLESMTRFTESYLDDVLLAAGARRKNLDDLPSHQLEMRFLERQMLAQAMRLEIDREIEEMEVRAYYEAHREDFIAPAKVRIRHIVVRPEQSDRIERRLEAGENFVALAKAMSNDAASLPDGSEIEGWIAAGEDWIPNIGSAPSLSRKLTAMEEGATTGPIVSARGNHWIQIIEKVPQGEATYEEVHDDLLRMLKAEKFSREGKKLLDRLHESVLVIFYKDVLKKTMEARARKQRNQAKPNAEEAKGKGEEAEVKTPAPRDRPAVKKKVMGASDEPAEVDNP